MVSARPDEQKDHPSTHPLTASYNSDWTEKVVSLCSFLIALVFTDSDLIGRAHRFTAKCKSIACGLLARSTI